MWRVTYLLAEVYARRAQETHGTKIRQRKTSKQTKKNEPPKTTNQEQSWASWNGRKGKVFFCVVSTVLIENVLSL